MLTWLILASPFTYVWPPKKFLYVSYGGWYLYWQIVGSWYCTFPISSTLYLVTIYSMDISKTLWIHNGNMYIESDLTLKDFTNDSYSWLCLAHLVYVPTNLWNINLYWSDILSRNYPILIESTEMHTQTHMHTQTALA